MTKVLETAVVGAVLGVILVLLFPSIFGAFIGLLRVIIGPIGSLRRRSS